MKCAENVWFTLSKAIGRDSFSIGAETDEPDDVVCDGIETVEAAELMDENDDAGRSEYNTSWLLEDGSETATAVIVDDEGSVACEVCRALSGGNLLLGGGSMAFWWLQWCNYFGTNFPNLFANTF